MQGAGWIEVRGPGPEGSEAPEARTLRIEESSAGAKALLDAMAASPEAPLLLVGAPAAAFVWLVRCSGRAVAFLAEAEDLEAAPPDWRHPLRHGPGQADLLLVTGGGPESEAALAGRAPRLRVLDEDTPSNRARALDALPRSHAPRWDAEARRRLLDLWEMILALRDGRTREELARIRRLLPAPDPVPPPCPPSPGRPLRVVAVSHDLSRTGAPLALLRLLAPLTEDPDLELHLVGIGNGELEDEARELFGARFAIAHPAEEGPHHVPILREIAAREPDLVLLNASPVFPLAALLAWRGTPYVWWWHEGLNVARRDGHWFSRPELEGIMRLCLHYPPRMLVPARDTRCELSRFCPALVGRLEDLPYGMETVSIATEGSLLREDRPRIRASLKIGEKDLLFICTGSLVRRKNQHRLVEAFQKHLDALPPEERETRHLHFVGELDREPEDSELERVRAALRPEYVERVKIHGPVPSAMPFMVAADAHVLVSTNECSPLVNIESFLLRTPVISSAVHGIPELVADEERGFLVDPEDVDSIADGLARFERWRRERPEDLDALIGRAWAHAVARHDVHELAEELKRILRDQAVRTTLAGGSRELPDRALPALQRQWTLRWALVKHDGPGTAHLARTFVRPGGPAGPRPGLAKRVWRALREGLR